MKNTQVKGLLRLLKRDKIIHEGEYQRIWNDYKELHNINEKSPTTKRLIQESIKLLKEVEKLLNDLAEIGC